MCKLSSDRVLAFPEMLVAARASMSRIAPRGGGGTAMCGAPRTHPAWEQLVAFHSGRLATSDWPRVDTLPERLMSVNDQRPITHSHLGALEFPLPAASVPGYLKEKWHPWIVELVGASSEQ